MFRFDFAYGGLRTSEIDFPLQCNIDLIARFAREKRVADLLRGSSAAVRVARRDRQSRHQEISRVVIAWARVTLTRKIASL